MHDDPFQTTIKHNTVDLKKTFSQ